MAYPRLPAALVACTDTGVASKTMTSRLEDIAAAATPACSVASCSGDLLPPPLLRAVLDLTTRNLKEIGVTPAELRAKRGELSHAETQIVAVRSGANLLGFAAYRLTVEEGVSVAYLYELHVEAYARGMRLGSELVHEVERRGREGGARGLMLTVHTRNEAARRWYKGKLHFEVSPISPACCAPP